MKELFCRKKRVMFGVVCSIFFFKRKHNFKVPLQFIIDKLIVGIAPGFRLSVLMVNWWVDSSATKPYNSLLSVLPQLTM